MTKTRLRLGTVRHLVLAALFCATPLAAQAPDPVLTRGRMLRISWAQQGLVSQMVRLDRVSGDTLIVKAKFGDRTRTVTEVLRIPLREVDAVEYASQPPRRVPRAVKGMLIGATLGVIGGVDWGVPVVVLAGGGIGALLGFAIGAILSFEPSEDSYSWRPYCTKPCGP